MKPYIPKQRVLLEDFQYVISHYRVAVCNEQSLAQEEARESGTEWRTQKQAHTATLTRYPMKVSTTIGTKTAY